MSAKSGSEESSAKFRLQFSPLLASVPAALAAALVGSRLGVQGTLIGAALTAVASGLVSQFATFGIERSHAGIKVVVARRSPDGDAVELVPGEFVPDAPAQDAPVALTTGRRGVHPFLAIAGVALTALATFGITIGVLTAAEAGAGRSLDGGYSSTVAGATKPKASAAPTTSDATSLTASTSPTPVPATAVPESPAPTAAASSPAPATTTPATAATTTPATAPAPSSTQSTTAAPAATATTPQAPAANA